LKLACISGCKGMLVHCLQRCSILTEFANKKYFIVGVKQNGAHLIYTVVKTANMYF